MKKIPKKLKKNYKNLLHFLHNTIKSKFKKNQKPKKTNYLKKNPIKITHFKILILK